MKRQNVSMTSESEEYNLTRNSSDFKPECLPLQTPKAKTKLNKLFIPCSVSTPVLSAENSSIRATEEMNSRVQTVIKQSVPSVDLNDMSTQRQFAPEYSQSSYETMMREEYALGDYLNPQTERALQITGEDRKGMVLLLEELNKEEKWKEETLYLAISIADRYLIYLAIRGQKAPCLIVLSVTCLLLAAKLEQPFSPSFSILNKILGRTRKMSVPKSSFLKLE